MTLPIDTLDKLTSTFEPADMTLLANRSLQKRIDQKYILPIHKLSPLLEVLQHEFMIVPTSNHNVAEYQTQYFDTPEYEFFTSHLRIY